MDYGTFKKGRLLRGLYERCMEEEKWREKGGVLVLEGIGKEQLVLGSERELSGRTHIISGQLQKIWIDSDLNVAVFTAAFNVLMNTFSHLP